MMTSSRRTLRHPFGFALALRLLLLQQQSPQRKDVLWDGLFLVVKRNPHMGRASSQVHRWDTIWLHNQRRGGGGEEIGGLHWGHWFGWGSINWTRWNGKRKKLIFTFDNGWCNTRDNGRDAAPPVYAKAEWLLFGCEGAQENAERRVGESCEQVEWSLRMSELSCGYIFCGGVEY